MRKTTAALTLATVAALAGCGGGATAPLPAAAPSSGPLTLSAATSSRCVPAQATPQTVVLPDTGGVDATVALAQYDAGATGCQNITIATGAAAAAATSATTTSSTGRETLSASSGPIVSMTLGQGLPSSLGLATVVTGVTLTTDANLNFPDGTYDATVQIAAYGVNTNVTVSLVFTASNGKLTISGGSGLPLNLGAGAQLLIYDRGVVPPGFIQPAPSPNPSATASPPASPTPTASPAITPPPTPSPTPPPLAGAPVPDGTTIGSFNATISGLPGTSYGNGTTYSGPIVYTSAGSLNPLQCTQDQKTGNSSCVFTDNVFDADIPSGAGVLPGTVSYVLSGLPAKSYRVNGCTGNVRYGGSGLSGVLTIPYGTLAFSDNCSLDFYSQPASVVNATIDQGGEYYIYSVAGPVSLGSSNDPAVDLQSAGHRRL